MLETIGVRSIRELFSDVPASLLLAPGSLQLPPAENEAAIYRRFLMEAKKNRSMDEYACFLGGGTYHHFVPSAVRYILSRGEFLTAYTPYQPEIAQGTLQTLFEFQTMIARLLAMDVANASMYDGATAVAEAALMALRITKRSHIVLSNGLLPRYRTVIQRYLQGLGIHAEVIESEGFATDIHALCDAISDQTAAVVLQYPDWYGFIPDVGPVRKRCDETGALQVVAFTDATAFALLQPPGLLGADIAAGSGQALGIPMGYGGPSLGLFACRREHLRQMPGRLCGMTKDRNGKRGFVLTLSTREQHIRRARATSNICTNQGLMATAATAYMSLLGQEGLKQVAKRSAAALMRLKSMLPEGLDAGGDPRFHETVITFPNPRWRERFLQRAFAAKIFAGIPLEKLDARRDARHLLVATSEMIDEPTIETYTRILKESRT